MNDTDRLFHDPLVIELAGDLDYVKAEALGEALRQAIEWSRRDTTVDLTAVPLIDSLTMAMMLRVHLTARSCGCTVTWSGIQPAVARMLEAAGLDQLLQLDTATGCARDDGR
jgi:anti-anti-sigma factor